MLTSSPPALVCLVLAAGRGKRMGMPKALMRAGESTAWWEVQIAALRAAGIPSLWVVSEQVYSSAGISQSAPSMLVVNSDSELPMFHSLRAGCTSLVKDHNLTPTRWIAVLPIDVPVPSSRTWQQLAQAAEAGGGNNCTIDAVVPEYRGKAGHPVLLSPAMVTEQVLGVQGSREGARLDRLIEGNTLKVQVDDPRVQCNINTPEDLRAYTEQSPEW
jgi:molybdenum cofactor cytidylyltransferase